MTQPQTDLFGQPREFPPSWICPAPCYQLNAENVTRCGACGKERK